MIDRISKQEAIEALSEGKKVSHRFFTKGEWMKLNPPFTLEFEDGMSCSSESFFAHRTNVEWETDWFIYNE